MQKQTFATVVGRDARGDEPSITISTVALDRDRDEIVPEGGDFAAYRQNPVVLFGHDYGGLPVGSTTQIEVVPGKGIRAAWKWLVGDLFADRVKNAFDQGVLRAASIGFLPLASEPNGLGGQRYTRWELTEWSLVPVPANAAAVRTLKALDLWRDDDVVLELSNDEPALEVDDSLAEWCAQHGRRSEPFGDPSMKRHHAAGETFDVDPPALIAAMREAFHHGPRVAIPGLVQDALARSRGRVD